MNEGRPPKPLPLINLHGTFRADRHAGRLESPAVPADVPDVPPDLTEDAETVWLHLCANLQVMGVLSKVDANAIERYAKLFARWRQCEKHIQEHGLGLMTPKGFAEFPELKESHRINEALRKLETQFGLTPSARMRLIPQGPGKKQEDPDAKFFGSAN